jgi:RNA polymerase sigma-70 factor (ECF subfamily)
MFQTRPENSDEQRLNLQRLLERYCGAVYRYVLGAVRDPDVAEELTQEFALRFLRGDFRRADPKRGRFRDYLKTSLVHLVTDHHRRRQAQPQQLAVEPAAAAPDSLNSDADFQASWRDELLDRTWQALAADNPGYHAALRLRIENPDLRSAEMAEQLTASLGKPVSAASARKMLERAHSKFADLLVDEVVYSLGDASVAELEEELNQLDLLKYCRTALAQRQEKRQL